MTLEPSVESITELGDNDVTHIHYMSFPVPVFNKAMLELAEEHKPDFIVYIGVAEGEYRPQIETLLKLKQMCPTVNFVTDGGCPNYWPILEQYRDMDIFTLSVNVDGTEIWPKRPNDLTTLHPVPKYYYAKSLQRDIKLGFHGGTGSEDRRTFISELGDSLKVGSRNEAYGQYQDYADFMLRCKYVLNMAKTGSGKRMHVKNRIVETGLAGACLFEPRNSPASQYFIPGYEYLEYETAADIRNLMEMHDYIPYGERLSKAICERHSAKQFWEKVINAI